MPVFMWTNWHRFILSYRYACLLYVNTDIVASSVLKCFKNSSMFSTIAVLVSVSLDYKCEQHGIVCVAYSGTRKVCLALFCTRHFMFGQGYAHRRGRGWQAVASSPQDSRDLIHFLWELQTEVCGGGSPHRVWGCPPSLYALCDLCRGGSSCLSF